MKLRFLIHTFTIFPKMTEISDEQGIVKYRLTRDLAAIGFKLHLQDTAGAEIALIRQKVSIAYRFLLMMNDTEFSIRPRYNRIDGHLYEMSVTGWRTFGDPDTGDYVILSDEKIIASVRKIKGDFCEVELADDGNTAMILAFVITIVAAIATHD